MGRSLSDPVSGALFVPLGWKEGKFHIYVRITGNDLPPEPYYDAWFTSVAPRRSRTGYDGYISALPGKHFVIEQSTNFFSWSVVKEFISDGSITHFGADSDSSGSRFFRARIVKP